MKYLLLIIFLVCLTGCSKRMNLLTNHLSPERLHGKPKLIECNYYYINKKGELEKDSAITTYYFQRNGNPYKIVYDKQFKYLLEAHYTYNKKDRVIIHKSFEDGIEVDAQIFYYFNKNGKQINVVSVFQNDTIINRKYVYHNKKNEETKYTIENDSVHHHVVKKRLKKGENMEELIYETNNGVLSLYGKNEFNKKGQKIKTTGYGKSDRYSYTTYMYNEQNDLIKTARFIVNKNDTIVNGLIENKYHYDNNQNKIREEHFFEGVLDEKIEYKIEYY